jgi:hypothetical protein
MLVKYQKVSTKEQAYEVIKTNITAETIAKYKVKAELEYKPDQYKIFASGKGFNLTMSFNDTNAEIELNLSLLLKPLKGKIMDSLVRNFERLL